MVCTLPIRWTYSRVFGLTSILSNTSFQSKLTGQEPFHFLGVQKLTGCYVYAGFLGRPVFLGRSATALPRSVAVVQVSVTPLTSDSMCWSLALGFSVLVCLRQLFVVANRTKFSIRVSIVLMRSAVLCTRFCRECWSRLMMFNTLVCYFCPSRIMFTFSSTVGPGAQHHHHKLEQIPVSQNILWRSRASPGGLVRI